MIGINAANTTFIEGHDFAFDPHMAVKGALTDLAYMGVSQLLNVFNQDELCAKIGTTLESAKSSNTTPINEVHMHEFDALVAKVGSFTAMPEQVIASGFVRFRNGTEGWHQDDSRKKPGIRALGHLEGPGAHLVALADNSDITYKGAFNMQPTPTARFLAVPYQSGAIVLLPQSYAQQLMVAADRGIELVEHPYHTGLQNPYDGYRQIFGIDITMGTHNYITGLDLQHNNVRTSQL